MSLSSRNRRLLATGALAVLVLGVAAVALNSIYASASSKVAVRTTTVQLGTVSSTVSATGNVSPAAALSVNFGTGGTVTAIDVKVGDHVTAGQPLAKIDDTQTKAALASAQAALASAQANLANVAQPLTPTIAAQNQAALATAEQQVVSAQTNLNAAVVNSQLNAVGYQNALNQAQAQLTRDTNQLNNDLAGCASPCTALNADQAAVSKDRDAMTNSTQQQVVGQVKDQQAIQQAQNSLLSAEAGLSSTRASNSAKAASTPASVAQAQSQVAQAQASLLTAQKNEADTTLTAPSDGTVAAVTGVVGQTVSGGGTSSASSSSSSGTGASASSSSSSSAFITLDNVTALQVVAGFAESDAGKIQAGQAASVTLNALPTTPVAGSVTKVDVTSTVVSNVVTYNVTIGLTNPPAGAKPGMTANVTVVVVSHTNVLHVPTADVSTRAGVSTVTVQQNGKPIVQVVSVGLVGDQSTEITSGLNEGDTIVEPTVSIAGTGTGTGTGVTTRGGGIFGGGGGGGGGGGLGGAGGLPGAGG